MLRQIRARRASLATLTLAAGAVTASMQPATVAQTLVSWNAPVSGFWSDGVRWSSGVSPSNDSPNAGDTYNVQIGAAGSLYSVTLNRDVTVSGFVLGNSADPTFIQNSNTLTVLNS